MRRSKAAEDSRGQGEVACELPVAVFAAPQAQCERRNAEGLKARLSPWTAASVELRSVGTLCGPGLRLSRPVRPPPARQPKPTLRLALIRSSSTFLTQVIE